MAPSNQPDPSYAPRQPQPAPSLPQQNTTMFPVVVLVVGWLLPGAGHFLIGKWVRALLLFAAILTMYVIGLLLSGKIYVPNTGDLMDMLGFAGQLGMGLLYLLARLFDWGAASVVNTLADYGTKFLVVAGLLNVISAIDAYSLANGRKASL
ncbi:MAG: DUF6677 family protein [Acidobacteriaceae bacterium]